MASFFEGARAFSFTSYGLHGLRMLPDISHAMLFQRQQHSSPTMQQVAEANALLQVCSSIDHSIHLYLPACMCRACMHADIFTAMKGSI
jgi:hypothetical protein